MYKVSLVRRAALLIAALFLGVATLKAAIPSAPEQLVGKALRTGDGSTVLQLSWFQSNHADVETFTIYSTRRESTDPNDFDGSGAFPASGYESGPIKLEGNNGSLTFTWSDYTMSAVHGASFYVVAGNADGASDPSTIIFLKSQFLMQFASRPVEHAFFGELYIYDANAEHIDGLSIEYSLIEAPQSMTIDPATGVIEWTADELFSSKVRLRATAEDGTFLTQDWLIEVRACASPAAIDGRLFDQNGDPVTDGAVYVYPLDYFDDPSDNRSKNYPIRLNIRDGSFSATPLDKGQYVMEFVSQARKYRNEWYDDAEQRTQAAVITLDCAEMLTIDWMVRSLPLPRYKVSGRVTWSEDGEGVSFARVDFIAMSRNVKGIPKVYTTYTSPDGSYAISLDDLYSYIARATTADTTFTLPDGRSFITQYYERTADPSEANAIELNGDKYDVDFVVEPRPVYNNSISGVVKKEADASVSAIVVAFNIAGEPSFPYAAQTVNTDDAYGFTLENLAPGEYIVYAIPYNRPLNVPGYYKKDDVAVQSWMEATRIEVGETDDVDNITIAIAERVGRIGNCIVDGSVRGNRSSVKSVDRGDRAQGDEEQAIDGALVYIVDLDDVIVDYRYTDDSGAFSIKDLEPGVYTLKVDKIGFEPFEQVLEFTFDGAEINVEAPLAEVQAVSVDEPVSGVALNALAFPNPAASTVTLKFEAQAGMARISVVNSAGIEALSALAATSEGVNLYRMNTNKLAAGMYTVRIESGAFTSEVSLRIVK